MSAATKAATLPEKAFGKAENSTFIRFLAYEGRFFAPAAGQRKQRIPCETPQIRGGVLLPPTVSVPAPKTDMEMTSATLPRVSVVGLGKLGAPLAAVLASRGFTVIGLDVSKVLVDSLNAGKMPIVEPQLNELIAANKRAAVGDDGCQRGDPEQRRELRDRADAVGQHRLLLQPLRAAGDGVARQGAAQQEGLPHGGHHLHGDAGHHRRRDQGGAGSRVGPQGRARPRPLLQSGIHRAGQRRARHALSQFDPDRRERHQGRRHAADHLPADVREQAAGAAHELRSAPSSPRSRSTPTSRPRSPTPTCWPTSATACRAPTSTS